MTATKRRPVERDYRVELRPAAQGVLPELRDSSGAGNARQPRLAAARLSQAGDHPLQVRADSVEIVTIAYRGRRIA